MKNTYRDKNSDKSQEYPSYNGRDFYKEIVEMAQEMAGELNLFCVVTSSADLVQQGLRWNIIRLQKHAGRDGDPLAELFFRKNFPQPQSFIEYSRAALLAQLERNLDNNHSSR